MRVKRSERLIDMTHYFLEHPNQLTPLSYFMESYGIAKSSVSEDVTKIKETFEQQNIGSIQTIAGAAGGVKFLPTMSKKASENLIMQLCQQLSTADRLLPGGYIYMSDILSNPLVLRQIGRLIASHFANQNVEAIMTIATKGIPLAQAVATALNIPFVIVRRDSKITEGATVNVNYVSGSSGRIEKMELSRRSLKHKSRVLIVDDFMKAGGTINGLQNMLLEFDATLVGTVVFAAANFKGERLVSDYLSLLSVDKVDVATRTIQVAPGNFLEKYTIGIDEKE